MSAVIVSTFLRDVHHGLTQSPRTLPCKYLYDERGSELFEQICEVDEYYLTRADLEATSDNVGDIVRRLGPCDRLVELGSGNSMKTRVLLDHLTALKSYVPVDIAADALEASAAALRSDYPHISVEPVLADYTRPFELPPGPPAARTVAYYPGSTVGNFHPPDAVAFLRRVRDFVGSAGALLIGVDLRKDRVVLERAYDDAAGVTAAFNLNLLARINAELGADFDLDAFVHRARYDEEAGRIEMHLASVHPQTVTIAGRTFHFEAGETIRSEVSYKYSLEGFALLAAEAGFAVTASWLDQRRLFSVQLLQA